MLLSLPGSLPAGTAQAQCRTHRKAVIAHLRGGRGLPKGVELIPTGGGPGGDDPNIVQNDPEGLFKGVALRTGIIERRMMQKRMEVDKEFAKAMSSASDELRKAVLLRRETRRAPENHEEIVEYFLNTLAEDLEYEVARYRPQLTPEFFQYLDGVLGAERFSAKPDEDRLAELDLLRKYLGEAVEAIDKCVDAHARAKERLKNLLSAKDKKQFILDLAANNEIDQPLMLLLDQNIEAAKMAEQPEAAAFMEKVKQACAKYMISTAATSQPAIPAAPTQLGARAAAAAGGMLLGGGGGAAVAGSSGSSSPVIAATSAPSPAAAPAAQATATGGAGTAVGGSGLILNPKDAGSSKPAAQAGQAKPGPAAGSGGLIL